MAKPKLCLIPAAQGSKLFSVLPSSGVGDFDFTRSGSATRINSQGLIETVGNGVSRLNYPMIDGVVKGCPHHILEPIATNQVPYSEDINNNAWAKVSLTVSPNEAISPDGSLNADKLTENTTTSQHRISDIVSLVSGQEHTISAFVKPNGSKWVRLRLENATVGSGQINVYFDIENGVVGAEGAGVGKIEKYPNGWYRCSATGTTNTVVNVCIVALADADGSSSYAGDASRSSYVWGVSVENSSYSTSYIPTNGSSTTRSAETANDSGDAATFNDSEGVFMVEMSAFDDEDTRLISIANLSGAENTIWIGLNGGNNTPYFYLVSSGSSQANYTSNIDAKNTNVKLAVKYKTNDVSFYVNGFELYKDTFATMPIGLTQLRFSRKGGSLPFYGKTKQIQYYDSALTDSELEQLTSWTSFSDMAEGQLYTIE
jgi:hypothetical protein